MRGVDRRILTGLVLLLTLIAALALNAYPLLFPGSLAEPETDLDARERRTWLDSAVFIDVRGNLSREDILRELIVLPGVDDALLDAEVEHSAALPWHDGMPWSTTRVTLNPDRLRVWEPETAYSIAVRDSAASFETITVPRVLGISPAGRAHSTNLPTNQPLAITFNEPVDWDDAYLEVEPRASFETIEDGSSSVLQVVPLTRWENLTTYTLTVKRGLPDAFGHPVEEESTFTFSTRPPPKITAVGPTTDEEDVDAVVQVQFERPVDRLSVEEAFQITPPVPGEFVWFSDTAVTWKPPQLDYSTAYALTLAGAEAADGDTFETRQWGFATHDPPVSIRIEGDPNSPTILRAVPSGGLGTGTYVLQWSTGETASRILAAAPYGETKKLSVTVRSGDREDTAAVDLKGLPYEWSYMPRPCPAGWYMLEISVCTREDSLAGPVETVVARLDLRDPAISLTAALAGARLGSTAVVSDQARATGAVVAVNGDFMHEVQGGLFPVGPVVSGGNYVFVPEYAGVYLGVDAHGGVATGKALDLRIEISGRTGARNIEAVNSGSVANGLALFNEYRGNRVSLSGSGCYSPFHPGADGWATAYELYCGSLASIPVPSGGVALVGHGAGAEWMRANIPGGLHLRPVNGLDFVVGGSHMLLPNIDTHPGYRVDGRQPRTAIGADDDGWLYLVVVDGRSASSVGMTIPELASYAKSVGATRAINLDGGGSSTIVVQGRVWNDPSDGRERGVASGVSVVRSRPECASPVTRCN